jgi:hypothetical protein
MRPALASALLFAAAFGCLPNLGAAAEDAPLWDAVVSGSPLLSLRARYENASQENIPETGEAFTLQTLLGWRTEPVWNTAVTVEAINVGRLDNDYNDGQNGKTQYPVIGDPDDTDINQLYVDWTGIADTRVRAGRQAILLDNVRFVGNVAFRQVMQVFNGVTVENRSLPQTRLFLGYIGRVKTVDTREHDSGTVLLNAAYALSAQESLVAYGYFQDQYDAIGAAGFSGPAPADTSNRIVGVRADGARSVTGDWSLLYTLEYASQTDYADGDARIDADYLRLGAGGRLGNYSLRLDQERLGSNDGTYGFQTPLATRHPFQGWADQFLTTPAQGLRDTYLTGGAKLGKAQLIAEYHRFKADSGGLDFGSELDLGVSYPLPRKIVGRVEYADYQAGDAASGKTDLRRIWLTLSFAL